MEWNWIGTASLFVIGIIMGLLITPARQRYVENTLRERIKELETQLINVTGYARFLAPKWVTYNEALESAAKVTAFLKVRAAEETLKERGKHD